MYYKHYHIYSMELLYYTLAHFQSFVKNVIQYVPE